MHYLILIWSVAKSNDASELYNESIGDGQLAKLKGTKRDSNKTNDIAHIFFAFTAPHHSHNTWEMHSGIMSAKASSAAMLVTDVIRRVIL